MAREGLGAGLLSRGAVIVCGPWQNRSAMSRIWAYERDPYRRQLETQVVGCGKEGGRPFVLLKDTILYPEGGGQPSDRGRLNEAVVLAVRRVGAELRHYVDAPLDLAPACLELDWSRRFDHMQQHTGQHLLTAVALDRLGSRTTAFHLGEVRCDIELDTPALAAEDLEILEEAVAAEIRAGRPVRSRRVSP